MSQDPEDDNDLGREAAWHCWRHCRRASARCRRSQAVWISCVHAFVDRLTARGRIVEKATNVPVTIGSLTVNPGDYVSGQLAGEPGRAQREHADNHTGDLQFTFV